MTDPRTPVAVDRPPERLTGSLTSTDPRWARDVVLRAVARHLAADERGCCRACAAYGAATTLPCDASVALIQQAHGIETMFSLLPNVHGMPDGVAVLYHMVTAVDPCDEPVL